MKSHPEPGGFFYDHKKLPPGRELSFIKSPLNSEVSVNYLVFIIEILVLMIKKTGTACIAIPAQTNVFI
jgi:hypothetical protein